MALQEEKMCELHKGEKDNYCATCNKAICLNCKFEHDKDHKIIHLAELASNMIMNANRKLEAYRGAVTKECDEISSLIHEFDEDKRHLYGMMKRLERLLLKAFCDATRNLTGKLQKIDEDLRKVKTQIDERVTECEQSDRALKQLLEYNLKKDYWNIYQMKERIIAEPTMLSTVMSPSELKQEALKDFNPRTAASVKGPARGNDFQPQVILSPLIQRKEDLRQRIATTDFAYLSEVNKEMQKSIKTLSQRFANEVLRLKQHQNLFLVKNNPDPLFGKLDKTWLSYWLLQGKSNKTIELELLYKATKTGFKAAEFHMRCDTHKPTLTLIAVGDDVFGGYTSVPWSSPSPGTYREDGNAFTFSLTKRVKCQIIHDKRASAVRHLQGAGPTFGAGEISISDQACDNAESYAAGNVSFSVPPDTDPKVVYTTSKNFKVKDIEVYRLKIS